MGSGKIKYKKGDSIIFGNYGAGYIEKIFIDNILETKVKVFDIKLLTSQIKLKIPFNDIEESGARRPATKTKINKLIKTFSNKLDRTTEKDIKKRYEVGIDFIDNSDVSIVVEMLYYLNKKNRIKPLSIHEKKQFNQLLNLFASEYAVVFNIPFLEAHEKIVEKLIF